MTTSIPKILTPGLPQLERRPRSGKLEPIGMSWYQCFRAWKAAYRDRDMKDRDLDFALTHFADGVRYLNAGRNKHFAMSLYEYEPSHKFDLYNKPKNHDGKTIEQISAEKSADLTKRLEGVNLGKVVDLLDWNIKLVLDGLNASEDEAEHYSEESFGKGVDLGGMREEQREAIRLLLEVETGHEGFELNGGYLAPPDNAMLPGMEPRIVRTREENRLWYGGCDITPDLESIRNRLVYVRHNCDLTVAYKGAFISNALDWHEALYFAGQLKRKHLGAD